MKWDNWDEILKPIFASEEIGKLRQVIKEKRKTEKIIPESTETFKSIYSTPLDDLKMVIVGREPYARNNGSSFAFSTTNGLMTEELEILFRAIHLQLYHQYNFEECFKHGNIESWSKQGILLLNSVHTVTENVPRSHHSLNWQYFTRELLKSLNEYPVPIVFLLVGKWAQEFKDVLTNTLPRLYSESSHTDYNKHLLLEIPYPLKENRKVIINSQVFYQTFLFLIQRRKCQKYFVPSTEETNKIIHTNIVREFTKHKIPLVHAYLDKKLNIFDIKNMEPYIKCFFAYYDIIDFKI